MGSDSQPADPQFSSDDRVTPLLQQLWHDHPTGSKIAASLLLGALATALYLVKSAAGIDLLPGPSPMHDSLYWIVRRG